VLVQQQPEVVQQRGGRHAYSVWAKGEVLGAV